MRVAGDPVQANNGVFYLLADHLGSTNVVVDEDGDRVGELKYKAWGETRYASGSLGTDYRYTGQREEAGIGLYYYHARWYDPIVGRFLSADPFASGDAYGYVINNPLRHNDPSGFKACDPDTPGSNCTQSIPKPEKIYTIDDLLADYDVTVIGATKKGDKIAVLASVAKVALALMNATLDDDLPQEAFKEVYGGLTFIRQGFGCKDCWGYTKSSHEIWIYSNANLEYKYASQFLIHEMGHAFAQGLGRLLYKALEYI
jgi:RHS repeat-associated protein